MSFPFCEPQFPYYLFLAWDVQFLLFQLDSLPHLCGTLCFSCTGSLAWVKTQLRWSRLCMLGPLTLSPFHPLPLPLFPSSGCLPGLPHLRPPLLGLMLVTLVVTAWFKSASLLGLCVSAAQSNQRRTGLPSPNFGFCL